MFLNKVESKESFVSNDHRNWFLCYDTQLIS